MRRWALAVVVAAMGALPGRARADVVLVDGIAAIVGDTPILVSAVDARVQRLLPALQQRTAIAMVPAATEVLKKEVLKQLIETELIFRAATDKGVTVTDAEVESALDSVALQNKLTRKELLIQVDHAGMTLPQYRVEITQQILRGKMLSLLVVPHIRITEEQIRAAYEALRAENPATPALEAARVAITQKLQADLLDKGYAVWVEGLRRATYVEERL